MRQQQTIPSEYGQAFTLEGIVSAMLMISVALIFTLQVTAITSLSSSTSSQHIENQQAELAQGIVETSERSEFAQTILYWNNSSASYHNADPDGQYRVTPPDTEFGNRIERLLLNKGIGVNIDFTYYQNNTTYADESIEFLKTGSPSNHAYTVTRRVPIYESDTLYAEDGTKSPTTVEGSTFYVNNLNRDTELYNVVIVRVTVWRI